MPTAYGEPPIIVVSASKSEHLAFDLPAAMDVVDASHIGAAQPRVNLSEALAALPGLAVQNRQNYAQDLQISSRGFGARSAFGVRGVRLLTDGVPATIADGQGQAATFNLDMAERIEVLRGPFSAIYGNHAGGVIQLFTGEGKQPAVELNASSGSDGMRKLDLNAQGRAGNVGYLLDASRFGTDGYRSHSAARRDQSYAKLTVPGAVDAKWTIIANTLHQHDTQDPLGVTWTTWQRDRRAGETDPNDTQTPQRTFAERYDTRKSIDHGQLAVRYEQRFGSDRLQLVVYGGNRSVIQYQAFSKIAQAPASSAGGVVQLDRDFRGMDLNWQDQRPLADGMLRTVAGIEYAGSRDDRQGYENFIGTTYGLQGLLRRDERDDLASLDPYLQLEWQRAAWQITGGFRYTRVSVDVRDRFLSNGNDSGSVDYRRTTPVLGVLHKVAPSLNLYASAASAFETPTLNELFYARNGAGFNFGLRPATSVHVELGAKARIGADTRIDAALFQARTHDELVVDTASGGRTSYRNAARTLRQGLELSAATQFGARWSARAAATVLRAVYGDGSRLPGVPNANLYGELVWNGPVSAALETVAVAKAYPDDANLASPAPGYAIVNARVQAREEIGQWRLRQFVRLNNLFDRHYIGSLIVGDANKRYYEAAPGRNWVLGASAQYLLR